MRTSEQLFGELTVVVNERNVSKHLRSSCRGYIALILSINRDFVTRLQNVSPSLTIRLEALLGKLPTVLARVHGSTWVSLTYSTINRLRHLTEKRVWPQRRGLAVIHCHRSILYRGSREAPAANQRHYRDATLKLLLTDLTFQSDSFVFIIKV